MPTIASTATSTSPTRVVTDLERQRHFERIAKRTKNYFAARLGRRKGTNQDDYLVSMSSPGGGGDGYRSNAGSPRASPPGSPGPGQQRPALPSPSSGALLVAGEFGHEGKTGSSSSIPKLPKVVYHRSKDGQPTDRGGGAHSGLEYRRKFLTLPLPSPMMYKETIPHLALDDSAFRPADLIYLSAKDLQKISENRLRLELQEKLQQQKKLEDAEAQAKANRSDTPGDPDHTPRTRRAGYLTSRTARSRSSSTVLKASDFRPRALSRISHPQTEDSHPDTKSKNTKHHSTKTNRKVQLSHSPSRAKLSTTLESGETDSVSESENDTQPAKGEKVEPQNPHQIPSSPKSGVEDSPQSPKAMPRYMQGTRANAMRSTNTSAEEVQKNYLIAAAEAEKKRQQEMVAVSKMEALLDNAQLTLDAYLKVRHKFEELDNENRNGYLVWNQMQDVVFNGIPMNQTLFRRMDKDRSGRVEFSELMYALFPRIPHYKVTAAMQQWGLPFTDIVADDGSIVLVNDWRSKFSEEQWEEIRQIYALFGHFSDRPITRKQLRKHVPPSDMPDALFDDLFNQADLDGDGALNLDEFAMALTEMYSAPPQFSGLANTNPTAQTDRPVTLRVSRISYGWRSDATNLPKGRRSKQHQQ